MTGLPVGIAIALRLLSIADLPLDLQQGVPLIRYAKLGEAATGEVVEEHAELLRLNVDPCARDRVIVIFRRPFAKDPASTIRCGGSIKRLVQVVQK
jgi:hypothetical protein